MADGVSESWFIFFWVGTKISNLGQCCPALVRVIEGWEEGGFDLNEIFGGSPSDYTRVVAGHSRDSSRWFRYTNNICIS